MNEPKSFRNKLKKPKGLSKIERVLFNFNNIFKFIILPILSLLIFIFILGLPYYIAEFIMNYNLASSDWLGFYGGYLGTLLGSLGVLLTIYYSNDSSKQERNFNIENYNHNLRIENMPFFLLEEIGKDDIALPNLCIEFDSKGDHIGKVTLILKNIGKGFATNFILDNTIYKDFEIKNTEGRTEKGLISINDSFIVNIIFHYPDKIDYEELVSFKVYFSDIFGNTYSQSFYFNLNFSDVSLFPEYLNDVQLINKIPIEKSSIFCSTPELGLYK